MKPELLEKLAKDFQEHPFWTNVMLPSMEASIQKTMTDMVFAEDTRKIRAMQIAIRTTQAWMGFPKRKNIEAAEDLEFEQTRQEDDGADEAQAKEGKP
jgi:hypothetical protein